MSDELGDDVYQLNWLGSLWFYSRTGFFMFIFLVIAVLAWGGFWVVSYLG